MKGDTLTEFIDDLLTMGGPEKEYEYRGKKYMLECQPYEEDTTQIELVIFECFGDENYIFRCHGKTLKDCVTQNQQPNKNYLLLFDCVRLRYEER